MTRYFDHIQSSPIVRAAADALTPAGSFAVVKFDYANAPKIERKADPPKVKKEKAPAAAVAAGSAEPAKDQAVGGRPKKEKKEKAPQQPKAPALDDGPPAPSMIDLRVGRIVDGEWLILSPWTCL